MAEPYYGGLYGTHPGMPDPDEEIALGLKKRLGEGMEEYGAAAQNLLTVPFGGSPAKPGAPALPASPAEAPPPALLPSPYGESGYEKGTAALDAAEARENARVTHRAVRMPDGKIVFTNLGAGAGGTELSEDASRSAAESAGFMRSPNPPPIQETHLPDTIGAPGDPSYRSFGVKPTYGSTQEGELVARADAAHRAGRHGQAEPWELKPGNDGLATPGYYAGQEQQAEDKIGSLDRRSAVADAAAKTQQAEEWARMSPEERRTAQAKSISDQKPNFNLQIIEHLQGQLAELDQRAGQIQSGLKLIVNKDNPDAKRLMQEGAAKLAEIEAQRQRIIQVGGLPFRADPLGMLLSGANQPPSQPQQ